MSRAVVPFVVLPQRIPACRSHQPFCFHILAASWVSFCNTLPLFSIVCSLFSKIPGVGYTPPRPPFGISNIQTLFPRLCLQISYPCRLHGSAPPGNPILFVLCFHNDTNCFSRNRLVFTTIRIARGCTPNFPIFRVQDLPGEPSPAILRFPPFRRSHFCYSAVALQCVIFAFLLRTSLWMRRDQSG